LTRQDNLPQVSNIEEASGLTASDESETNSRIIHVQAPSSISIADMYRSEAVMLLSHCLSLSFKKTIDLLRRYNCSVPSIGDVRYISTNTLAYSPTNRGNMGKPCWNSQRDPTPMIGEFESTAFRTSLKVFCTQTFTVATLDDDMYGSRAADNQFKKLSSRKSDKDGHCGDSLADSIFCSTPLVRFRRRGDSIFKC
jgi:hypothetical protein